MNLAILLLACIAPTEATPGSASSSAPSAATSSARAPLETMRFVDKRACERTPDGAESCPWFSLLRDGRFVHQRVDAPTLLGTIDPAVAVAAFDRVRDAPPDEVLKGPQPSTCDEPGWALVLEPWRVFVTCSHGDWVSRDEPPFPALSRALDALERAPADARQGARGQPSRIRIESGAVRAHPGGVLTIEADGSFVEERAYPSARYTGLLDPATTAALFSSAAVDTDHLLPALGGPRPRTKETPGLRVQLQWPDGHTVDLDNGTTHFDGGVPLFARLHQVRFATLKMNGDWLR